MKNLFLGTQRKTKGIAFVFFLWLAVFFSINLLIYEISQADMCDGLNIPPGHLPPHGLCRIWTPGVPPGHQGPVVSCSCEDVVVPYGSCLINEGGNSVKCDDDCSYGDCEDKEADLSVVKHGTPEPVEIGEILTYEITVSNQGPEDADNVRLYDIVPNSVELDSVVGCEEYEFEKGVLTCELNNIDDDDSKTVYVIVIPYEEGTLVNETHVKSPIPDPDMSNNFAVEHTMVIEQSDDLPRLDLDSAAGHSGGVVIVPAILSNSESSDTSLTALSMTVEYDADLLYDPLVLIGPAASSANKGVVINEQTQGSFVVSVWSLDNNNSIGNGIVFYLTLKIQPSAENGLKTTLFNTPSASDPFGNLVPIEGSDGIVTISDIVPGDCSGDGIVDIAEVQAAIDMFLNIIPVKSCADANGDGEVSIDELQTIIFYHLGILPEEPDHSVDLEDLMISGITDKRLKEADELPELEVAEVTGIAGQSEVVVPINLNHVEGYGISAVAIDLVFDTNVLQNPTVTIGPAGTASDKKVVSNKLAGGKLRIGVLSTSSEETFKDGTAAYVHLSVAEDAAKGKVEITVSPSASGVTGNIVPVEGRNGGVKIIHKGVSKDKGTVGSLIALAADNSGKRVSVRIGNAACKVISRQEFIVRCKLKKALPEGLYDITVKYPGQKPQKMGLFNVMLPEIDSAKVITTDKGKQVLRLEGKYFGTSKGKVMIAYFNEKGKIKEKKCKVSKKKWIMEPETEVSEITCRLPKKASPESILSFTVKNKAGETTF